MLVEDVLAAVCDHTTASAGRHVQISQNLARSRFVGAADLLTVLVDAILVLVYSSPLYLPRKPRPAPAPASSSSRPPPN